MATSAAVPPALCLKRPSPSESDEVALLKKMRSSAEDRLTVESLMEHQSSEALPSLAAAHRSFPCVWMNGSSPNRDAEGGEKSPNPPPPQLALPLETEGASTERSLGGPTAVHPLLKTPDQTTTPPRNPFEERPGLEHLFRSLHGGSTPSDSETSVQSAEPDQQAAEVCPECHKVFKRKVYLQRHMEREHWSTAKVFKCDDCSYETKHQSNLSVHRRTHTGERPYHCGCCGQRYTQGHLLKSHIRSRHGGNMEFYNLDKKSDSTRGRKSLDLKHDAGGMAGPKVDKISALLQAAANKNSPIMPPMPKFNNLLPPPHMSGFPYFNTGMRPMNGMMNPVMSLANSLLGGPRFFTIGGMPPNTGMLPSPSAISSSAALASFTQSPLLHSSASEPLNFTKEDLKATVHSESLLKQKAEDLSKKLKREDLWETPPKEAAGSPAPPTTPSPRDAMPALSPVSTPMSEEGGKAEDELYEEVSHSPPATVPASCCPSEAGRSSQCQHLRKLQSLRRNVFRMLSTFTPDLSEENGIQDDGDDVDELLHEVIFSNIDDFMSAKE
ncbi:hypothetical protein CAPTEDRAFT_187265 [Capitella teleta]|uniref:C2H2-type domain-containing protein n=1 Tax=Capitella teleta TaxID=283909 RepID=X1ZK33_CAPTE|nr:hypothetical protein CAPTEDRAFT_187265 [Capitella teleta]|eukprot:ELU10104.1 hypothetical protein CAPTEDRAFT_187265 [Capitella teleta]